MAQLKNVVEPYGEVNVNAARQGGTRRVTATILMEPVREGTQTGIALDGSGSMASVYGAGSGLGREAAGENQMTPVARRICAHLARKLDADGGTTVIYWATGDGKQVEVVGDLTAEQAEAHAFARPRHLGGGTCLLPAVQYFADRFKDAPWGFYVFLTDGALGDLEAVKDFTRRLAVDIHAGRRNPLKLVLVGLGTGVDERQMSELDDLDTGTPVDIWDHKLASDMRSVHDIFAEVVDRNARVAPSGRVVGSSGRVLKDYPAGVPALLEFDAPAGEAWFALEAAGGRWPQSLTDAATAPPATPPPGGPGAAGAAPDGSGANEGPAAANDEVAGLLDF